jgi:hypothetical protein
MTHTLADLDALPHRETLLFDRRHASTTHKRIAADIHKLAKGERLFVDLVGEFARRCK